MTNDVKTAVSGVILKLDSELTETGAAVHMQAGTRVAFTVVGAPGVNTSVLAASIVDQAFINICGEKDRGRQKERHGREMSVIYLNPLIMRKKENWSPE